MNAKEFCEKKDLEKGEDWYNERINLVNAMDEYAELKMAALTLKYTLRIRQAYLQGNKDSMPFG